MVILSVVWMHFLGERENEDRSSAHSGHGSHFRLQVCATVVCTLMEEDGHTYSQVLTEETWSLLLSPSMEQQH